MGMMHERTRNGHTYIIAEAGQNHNGSFEKAKWLIDIAALKIGHGTTDNVFSADAIKFTKRDMSEELTTDEYNRPYPGPHSYGETYGKHREALELTYEEHAELFLYAKSKGLDFIETVCSPKCLRLLDYFRPDFLKIASRDIDNYPLLEAIGKTDIPVIISTGMSDIYEIINATEILGQDKDITILHCVSKYPSNYEDLNLKSIDYLKEFSSKETISHFCFNKYVIGFSDHTNGVLAPALAVAHGAKVIEKHITYNKLAKGTDHAGSMDQEGYARVIRDIRNTELSKGVWAKNKPSGIEATEKKLRRVLCTSQDIKAGDIINDFLLLSGQGDFTAKDMDGLRGSVATVDIPARTGLEYSHFL